MADCVFCERFEEHKEIENFWLEKDDEPSKYEYTVALVIRSWKPSIRSKRDACRITDYRNQGIGYKLNFCPECGRKLRGR